MSQIKYILFDMDGVLVDSMSYHIDSWQEAFKFNGIEVSRDELISLGGVNQYDTVQSVSKKHNIEINDEKVKAISKRKTQSFENDFEGTLFEGVKEELFELKKLGFRFALVTGALREIVHKVLEKEVLDLFEVVVCGNDLKYGKPNPEPYHVAMEKLNTKSNECIVIEDSVMGIRSGKAAGVNVVAITTTNNREKLNEADVIVENHEELFEYLRGFN